MGLKNTPPSMFVESKIFGNFKFDSPPEPLFYALLLNYYFKYAIFKQIKNISIIWVCANLGSRPRKDRYNSSFYRV